MYWRDFFIMNKKIAIVTGATGSIGYKIVESLILNNYKVIAIAQNLSKLKNVFNTKVTGIF